MRLATIATLSLALAALLCYGALRTAERIARAQTERIEHATDEFPR